MSDVKLALAVLAAGFDCRGDGITTLSMRERLGLPPLTTSEFMDRVARNLEGIEKWSKP